MNFLVSLLAMVVGLINFTSVSASFDMADNCRVFCQGPLLEAVQNAHLFHDSKDFVDMPLKYSLDETLLAFDQLENKTDHAVIKQFVDDFFNPPGTELDPCHPGDWTAHPKSFEKIEDPVYRQWAYDIHRKWPSLCRRVIEPMTFASHSFFLTVLASNNVVRRFVKKVCAIWLKM
jgi:alpha,alpha-trehalase